MRNPHKRTRPAYCTGCGRLFHGMHQLYDHRHTFRCGGKWWDMEQKAWDYTKTNLVLKITPPESYKTWQQSKKKKVKVRPTYQFDPFEMRWHWMTLHELRVAEAKAKEKDILSLVR